MTRGCCCSRSLEVGYVTARGIPFGMPLVVMPCLLSCPVNEIESFDSGKFAGVGCDECQSSRESLSGDENIIWADRCSATRKRCTDFTCNASIL